MYISVTVCAGLTNPPKNCICLEIW